MAQRAETTVIEMVEGYTSRAIAATFGGCPAASLPMAISRSVSVNLGIMVFRIWGQQVSERALDC